MIPADETYDGTWPYAPQFFDGCGFRQHYVDVRGDPIVCLHIEPTWGYLYRRMIDPLAEHGQVIVPDHGVWEKRNPARKHTRCRPTQKTIVGLIEHLDLRTSRL